MKRKNHEGNNKKTDEEKDIYYRKGILISLHRLLIKNMLLQAYINGDNLYSPDFGEAISATWRYWIFYIAVAMIILSVGMLFKKDKARSIYISVCNFFFTVLVC